MATRNSILADRIAVSWAQLPEGNTEELCTSRNRARNNASGKTNGWCIAKGISRLSLNSKAHYRHHVGPPLVSWPKRQKFASSPHTSLKPILIISSIHSWHAKLFDRHFTEIEKNLSTIFKVEEWENQQSASLAVKRNALHSSKMLETYQTIRCHNSLDIIFRNIL
jgi:hypothetical protein